MPVNPPSTRPLVQSLVSDLEYVATLDLAYACMEALSAVTSKTARTVKAFCQAVMNGVDDLDSGLAQIHERVGKAAQEAILSSYEDQLLHKAGGYRTNPKHERNRRYADGVLASALSEGLVTSNSRGIYIGNVSRLDEVAKQWARLNYGAGAAGAGGSGGTFTVRLSDLEAFVFSDDRPSRPSFTLPAGRWIGQEFYPYDELTAEQMTGGKVGGMWAHEGAEGALSRRSVGETVKERRRSESGRFQKARRTAVPTRGIRGIHYIDAGLRTISELIGPAYLQLFQELWEKADASAKDTLRGDTGIARVGSPKTSYSER